MGVGYIFGCIARMEYGKIIEWSSTVWLQESVSSFYSIFSTLFSNGSFVWLLFSVAVTSNRTCILKVICNDWAEGSKNGQTIKKYIRFFSSFVPLLGWCFFMRFHRFYYSKDNICTSRLKLLRAQMKKIQVVANNPNVYTGYFKYRLRVFFHVYLLPWNIIFMVVVCIICTAFWMIHMHTYIIESGYKYTQSEKKNKW